MSSFRNFLIVFITLHDVAGSPTPKMETSNSTDLFPTIEARTERSYLKTQLCCTSRSGCQQYGQGWAHYECCYDQSSACPSVTTNGLLLSAAGECMVSTVDIPSQVCPKLP
jgi:hypothetical protein